MQKYQDYRQEIARSTKLGYAIDQDNMNIQKYKEAIDKINREILTSMDDESINLHKGVSEVAVSHKQIPVEIQQLFSTMNKAKNTINQENVAPIFDAITNSSIIDKNNNVKENWLKQDQKYSKFCSFEQVMNEELKQDLTKDFENKFGDLKIDAKQEAIAMPSLLSKDDKKQWPHYMFVISVTVAVIFFVITIALMIARGVL